MTYRVNLNIDKTGISPQMFIDKTEQLEGGGFGEHSPAEFAVNVLMNGVSAGHPKGNIQSIRRTLSLNKILSEAASNGGIAELEDEDYKYIKSSFSKADQWNNSIEIATVLDRVYKTIEQAEEIK